MEGDSYTKDKENVERLCAIEDGLTSWEMRFVDSIATQVVDKLQTLTDKQRAIVNKILERLDA